MCGLLLGTGFKYLIVSKVWAGSDCVDAYGMCAKRLKMQNTNSFWAPLPIPLSSRNIRAIFATNHPSKRFDPLKVKKMAIEKCAHALSMRFLVSNLKYRGSGQGSDKSMGWQKSYDGCHIFVHTGCLTNVTHRMQLKPKKPNQNWVLWD